MQCSNALGALDTSYAMLTRAARPSHVQPGAALGPLAPALDPLLEWLRDNPEGIVLLIGVTPLLLLTVLMIVRTSGRRKVRKRWRVHSSARGRSADQPGPTAQRTARLTARTRPIAR